MRAGDAAAGVRASHRREGAAHAGRVAVTGIGLLTPLGRTAEAFDEALFEGRSAVERETLRLEGLDPMQLALARCDFDASATRSTSRLPLDRGTAMALCVAQDAAAQAGLAPSSVDPERLGVFWGSGMAGAATFDSTAAALYGEHRRMRPTTVLTVMPNAAVAEIALHFGARGSAIGYACACASSAVAIGEAMRAIRGGWLDVAIVGGHEAMLTPGLMAGWQAMRVLATPPADAPSTACRPFSADRTGFALGEGAAALVLESESHARARGVPAHSMLIGYATNCDGSHITNPDSAGQSRVMRAALRDAGLEAAQIGYINAHGTATSAGDAAEAASILAVFGNQVPVSATKAIHGHLLGGGGAVELVATLRALAREALPPTAHLHTPDAAFDLDFVRGAAREAAGLRHAMSNSFAFGGTNAVIVAARTTAD
ncbi:beta-ketoacyl-[acyl-carrier-protein] synthase family protein [Variovorax sp. PBL-E5]|uniref:beta-ketoacyl-[acyl-carrier-protein] synthase family protein n=1 Tax=Variovorax sp. PBL-E5 TaxID=434014 RepID=UPI001315BCA4|nr:beta-ketoacyl-[acyl-carrier-protein] synthase family protein [Variovorax sp. PBL-E5]VTU16040.1 3-oxoacyl-[acyl-carrier-protein] synthase 2 [Variovorax sp. PBL-E5]